MPAPTETAPPPVTPPPAAPKPEPFIARILEDMGKAITPEGNVADVAAKPAEAQPENVISAGFTSMGEIARFKKEKEESKTAEEKTAAEKVEADKKAEEEKAKKEAEEKAKPGEATPPAAPKKIEVEKAKPLEEIIEGVVKRVTPPPPPPAEPKKEEKPAADPDAEFIESLDEDQRESVELARYAAKAMPDKYAKLPERMVGYLKKVEGEIAKRRQADSDWDPEQDDDFKAFLEENAPEFPKSDRRKLERQQIVEEAEARVEARYKPQREQQERETRSLTIKPELDKAVESYETAVAQRFMPDEKSPFYAVFKPVMEKHPKLTQDAWETAKSIDPLATSVAKSFLQQASTLGREYLELASGVAVQVPYRPELGPADPQNQRAMLQARLFSFIDNQEQIFARDGGDMRIVNGKSFVTRRQYAAMPPAEQAKHWILGHDDVLDMLAVAAANEAKGTLERELKRREEEGYVRKTGDKPPKKEETQSASSKAAESPKATTTPAPGAANPPPPPSSPTLFTEDELKRQWGGGPAIYRN